MPLKSESLHSLVGVDEVSPDGDDHRKRQPHGEEGQHDVRGALGRLGLRPPLPHLARPLVPHAEWAGDLPAVVAGARRRPRRHGSAMPEST